MRNVIFILLFLSVSANAQPLLVNGWKSSSPSGSITYVNSADLGNTTATSLTNSFTVSSSSNRFLVVSVVGDNISGGLDNSTGVTVNGVAMTYGGNQSTFGGRYFYLYYMVNPPSGSQSIIASFGSSHYVGMLVAEYSGVAQTSPLDISSYNTTGAAATTLTTSLTVGIPNAWTILIECGYNGNSNPPSAGTGATRRVYASAFSNNGIFDSNGPLSTGSYSMTTTRTNTSGGQGIGHIMFSIKPAP